MLGVKKKNCNFDIIHLDKKKMFNRIMSIILNRECKKSCSEIVNIIDDLDDYFNDVISSSQAECCFSPLSLHSHIMQLNLQTYSVLHKKKV